jgi:DNA-binding transcriptional LysR family regulator
VTLTEAGRTLYGFALRLFELHRAARESVTGTHEPVTGTLTLAASSVPGEHLLPGLLSDFGRRYPHVQVRATVGDSAAVLRQVEHGDAHLGLVGVRRDNPHLEFKSFACDRLVVVVPASHPWRRRKRLPFAQLAGQPLILREPGSGSRYCLEQALTLAGKSLRDLHVVLELGSNEAIKEAVLRGIGAAILSTHVVKKEVESDALHTLEIADLPLRRDIFVVRDTRRVLPPTARLFLALIETPAG